MDVVENRIFINQVPQSASKEDLSAHFSQFGSTLDVYLPNSFSSPGAHKGICFVTYASADSVDLALKSPAHMIHGQPVTVELCLPKKGDGKGLPGFSNSGGQRVFVTNIGQEVTEEEVQAYFAQWGDWTDIYMPKGSFTAGHKGICFISYKDPAAVTQVLQYGVHQLRGQPVVVDVAVPRGGPKGGGKRSSQVFVPRPSTSRHIVAAPGHPPPVYHSPYLNTSTPSAPPPMSGTPIPDRLFLTKMDRTITKEDLTAYFEQFGQLNDVFIPSGGKQIGFVGFVNASSTQAILRNKTHEVKSGCTVDVDMAIERPPLGSKGQGKGRVHPY